jgi:hypothetical protein
MVAAAAKLRRNSGTTDIGIPVRQSFGNLRGRGLADKTIVLTLIISDDKGYDHNAL